MAEVPALAPMRYQIKYNVGWNDISIGRLRVNVKEDAFAYSMTIDTKTSGIMKLFSAEKRIATVRGRVRDGKYIHSAYESKRLDKPEITQLAYDENGDLASRKRVPEDTPTYRPAVPKAEVNTATDPSTAFFTLRKLLHAGMAVNQRKVSVKSYDGARLADMQLEVISPARVKVWGKYENAINTVLERKPLSGYTPKEQKKYAEGDPTVHVYWSTDGKFIPLKIEIVLGFGTVTAVLAEFTEVK